LWQIKSYPHHLVGTHKIFFQRQHRAPLANPAQSLYFSSHPQLVHRDLQIEFCVPISDKGKPVKTGKAVK
jgi:hypothetical protein